MWIMAPWGAIMPSLRYPKDIAEGDDREIQVRARRVQDIDRFRSMYCPELGPNVIGDGTDYEVRAFCTHAQLGAGLAKMALDINYQSFKSQSEKVWHDAKLHTAYVRIWAVLYDVLSTRKAFSGGVKIWKGGRWETTRTTTKTTTTKIGTTRAGTGEWRRLSDLTQSQRDRLWNELEHEIDPEIEMSKDEIFDEIERRLDAERTSQPARHRSGNIDHSQCTHGASKNARRRCRRFWDGGGR